MTEILKFHEKLQNLRKEKGLSQEALAELLDISRQSVSKWESGQSYPETEKMIALSQMFGVTLDSLIKDGELESDEKNDVSEPFWRKKGNYFEYKSKRTLFGLPLVHIFIGFGKKAKGVLAVGLISQGIFSIGLLSLGLFSVGLLGAGLIGVGVLGVGALLGLGAFSIGFISVGSIALGVFSLGAVSVGMFSFGAVSLASHVAIGDHASGHIAIGRVVNGVKTIEVEEVSRVFREVSKEQVRSLLESEFPNLWEWIKNFIVNRFS